MKKEFQLLIFFIVLFGIIFFGIFQNSYEEKELNEFGVKAKAKIIEYKFVGKTSYSLEYEYFVNDKRYIDSEKVSFFKCDNGKNGCVGKEFNIIYSKKNPALSKINLGKYNRYKKQSPTIKL